MNDLETMPNSSTKIIAGWDMPDCEDEMEAQIYWEDFLEDIEILMRKMRTNKFFAYGFSLTWRNVAGYTEFIANNPSQLVRALAPKTDDFTMLIHPTENRDVYKVVLSHHDKPTGETLYLMSQNMEKKLKIRKQYFGD
jgi:hypothetical protein